MKLKIILAFLVIGFGLTKIIAQNSFKITGGNVKVTNNVSIILKDCQFQNNGTLTATDGTIAIKGTTTKKDREREKENENTDENDKTKMSIALWKICTTKKRKKVPNHIKARTTWIHSSLVTYIILPRGKGKMMWKGKHDSSTFGISGSQYLNDTQTQTLLIAWT